MNGNAKQIRKLISDIYLILTLDCEGSAKLTSDSFDRDLDWAERTAALMHRMICGKSRKLHRQLVQLNATLKSKPSIELSSAAKERIRAAIGKDRNLND